MYYQGLKFERPNGYALVSVMTDQEVKDPKKKKARYKAILGLSCFILFIILSIKFLLPFIGINLDSNPISDLHWSYYVLTLVGALSYVATVQLRHPRGECFDGWRAASDAAKRIAQAVIYTIIILNVYGNTIVINAQTSTAISGAILALFIGMYIKLFERSIGGIAKKLNFAVSSEAKESGKTQTRYEKIKEELEIAYDQLVGKCAKEPEKYKGEREDIIKQIETNTEFLKSISKHINERALEEAKESLIEMEARARIIKIKYGII